ncbi:MAG: 4-hydroxy-2-oxovalerate aldolase [Gammaproteobacteria bacterium]|nr:4-hydroxy-2-oxovalerate aldolase [Gammaproteobacteria bacterium]
MNNTKILDVTLRDGGYKTNFNFSPLLIANILRVLDTARIPYIEVGYRNGSYKAIPEMGPSGYCDNDYLQYCRKFIHYSKLVVMCHPKNIPQNDFVEMKECGVDSVRICFPIDNENSGYKSIERALKSGLDVFVNITRISRLSDHDLMQLVKKLSNYPLVAIYLADSNGSLTPEKIGQLYSNLIQITHIPLGFHAHDNLFLAQSNAISAINCGATFIDASLFGIGKGAGNLRTEALVTYLSTDKNKDYDLCLLLEMAEKINQDINQNFHSMKTKDIIMGIFDLSQDDMTHFLECKNAHDYYRKAEYMTRKLS